MFDVQMARAYAIYCMIATIYHLPTRHTDGFYYVGPNHTHRGLVDPYQLINIAVIVLIGYIAIVLLTNIQSVSSCTSITNSTMQKACNSFFNNAGVLFLLFGVMLLLLVIPLIRSVIGGRIGGGQ